jgi:hypothetical protein
MSDIADAHVQPSPPAIYHPRRLLSATGYLLTAFWFAMVVFTVLLALFVSGVGTVVLLVGLPLVSGALRAAQGFGRAERRMLRWTGLPLIAEPEWPPGSPGAHWTSRLLAPLRSSHHWAYLLHQMIVSPVLSIVSFSLTVTWWAVVLGGFTFPMWQGFLPDREPGADWPGWIASHWVLFGGWSSRAVELVLYLVAAVLFGVTLPWVVGGLARAHHAVARVLLGRWRGDDLAALAREEAAARAAAVHAEDTAMRRLERDLHDGPQQRLIRLQLDLAAPSAVPRRAIPTPRRCSPARRRYRQGSPSKSSARCRGASHLPCCPTGAWPPRSAPSRRTVRCRYRPGWTRRSTWSPAPTLRERSTSSPPRCSPTPPSTRAHRQCSSRPRRWAAQRPGCASELPTTAPAEPRSSPDTDSAASANASEACAAR